MKYTNLISKYIDSINSNGEFTHSLIIIMELLFVSVNISSKLSSNEMLFYHNYYKTIK